MRVVDGGGGAANDGGGGGVATRTAGTRSVSTACDGFGCGRDGGTVRATTRKAEDDDVRATAECSVDSARERHRTA